MTIRIDFVMHGASSHLNSNPVRSLSLAQNLLHLTIPYDMVSHMKTTVQISDALLKQAKAVAARERTTLRTLIEEGLHHVVKKRRIKKNFRLRKASFRGDGLMPHADEDSWERIRSLIYEERGG